MNVPRIIVADHHPLCRAGLPPCWPSNSPSARLVQASDFPHTLAAIARSPVTTMVTVNMKLPGMNGVAGLRKLRADHPSLLLVVVAESRERELVLDALCAGVHGYILKDTPVDEMTRAFESVLLGHIYVPPLVSDVTVKTCAATVVTPTSSAALTDRQFEVLKLVAAGRSNKEIARALFIAEGTVKVHITAASARSACTTASAPPPRCKTSRAMTMRRRSFSPACSPRTMTRHATCVRCSRRRAGAPAGAIRHHQAPRDHAAEKIGHPRALEPFAKWAGQSNSCPRRLRATEVDRRRSAPGIMGVDRRRLAWPCIMSVDQRLCRRGAEGIGATALAAWRRPLPHRRHC